MKNRSTSQTSPPLRCRAATFSPSSRLRLHKHTRPVLLLHHFVSNEAGRAGLRLVLDLPFVASINYIQQDSTRCSLHLRRSSTCGFQVIFHRCPLRCLVAFCTTTDCASLDFEPEMPLTFNPRSWSSGTLWHSDRIKVMLRHFDCKSITHSW